MSGFWCAAILVVAVGVLGLVDDSWSRKIVESWINIHTLFGFLLWGFVIARFYWRAKHSPLMLPSGICELSRHLSREVYLLLYIIVGVREIVGIANVIWYGGTLDFNLFDKHFRNGPDRAGFEAKEDFQAFLAYGLVALVIIRTLAFRIWLRIVDRSIVHK